MFYYSISEALIPQDELRTLRWRAAAEDVKGNNALFRLGQFNGCLVEWKIDDLVLYIKRLSSTTRKRSWLGFDGRATLKDEVMAAEVEWIVKDYAWKGYGIPAMSAICQLVPVPFTLQNNFNWFDTPAMNECRTAFFKEEVLDYNNFCARMAVWLKKR